MTQHLYDLATNERLGVATREQIEASDAAGSSGAILVDLRTGEVLTPSTFAAREAAKHNAARTVYTY